MADAVGRAYPKYWQTTLAVHAPHELVPCAIDSGDGKSMLMVRAPNDEIVDRALRASCSEMGSRVGMAARPTTTERVRRFAVLNTVSLAWRIGRCIARCEAANALGTGGRGHHRRGGRARAGQGAVQGQDHEGGAAAVQGALVRGAFHLFIVLGRRRRRRRNRDC